MSSATTTFRLSGRDRRVLDELADTLICSRTDVLRYAMAALHNDDERLDQIRGENLARTFLQSLRTQYGENAVLELVDGDPAKAENWRLADEPLDPEVLSVAATQQGDRWVLDLVDQLNDVKILNVMSWDGDDGRRHAVVPLRDLWVHASAGASGEPETQQVVDGRTVVRIAEDDGTVRYLAIDDQGNSARLADSDIPGAAFGKSKLPASVGIGVRRESILGPHLGQGVGGQWRLTGDLDADRKAAITTLEQLLEQARNCELDDLLALPERSAAQER